MVVLIFVAGAVLSWGAYGVLLAQGQSQLGNPLKALLCVGAAYFLIGVIVPVAALGAQGGLSGFNTGGLVNEAYLRLVDQTQASWRDRGHFFAVCAIAMRQIVVDHARRRARQKRGGEQAPVPLDEARDAAATAAERGLDADLALRKLAETDRRLAAVVDCRYFAGLTDEETALALGLSVRTAQREWFKARAWLRHELSGGKA